MELNKSIDNPSFDGRKRHGYQALKLFPKGERFALSGGNNALKVRFINGGEDISDDKLIVAMLAAAGPVKAANFREVSATLPWVVDPEVVLDILYERGDVDEAKLREAAQLAHDRATEG